MMKNKPRCSSSSTPQQTTSSSSIAASSLVSGAHGRKRRQERQISKIDLQRARRYGMAEPARFGRIKYTLGGKVFIYDPSCNAEITSYPSADAVGASTGSHHKPPILLAPRVIPPHRIAANKALRERLLQNKDTCSWTSHSVLVVDMSGSMRRDDVTGARCRADAVWMALARDYVQRQLEQGLAVVHESTDVVSLVVMAPNDQEPQVLLQCEPFNWILYNRLLDLREWRNLRPSGAGCYLPALQKARELLNINNNTAGSSNCALALLFFSDGRPSDPKADFTGTMGAIAAQFGQRLSVSCIGMAEPNESFDILRDMVQEAGAYGATASFEQPALDTIALSTAVSSLATSLADTKTALTSLQTNGARRKVVRTDFVRERKNAPEDLVPTSDWVLYPHDTSSRNYVKRLWIWDAQRDNFVYLMDSRCIFCYKTVSTVPNGRCRRRIAFHTGATTRGAQCPDCKACFICVHCLGQQPHRGTPDCLAFLSDRRTKAMVTRCSVPSFAVALKKTVFGEGAERIVRQFRFLDDNDEFVGNRWVAKESRFIEEAGQQQQQQDDSEARMDYHREFARTQVLANEFARQFNRALDALTKHFQNDASSRSWLRKLPRVRFLTPMVVELVHGQKPHNILIEEMLEGPYQKFNNNMGYVLHQQRRVELPALKEDDDDDKSFDLSEDDDEQEESVDGKNDEFGRLVQKGLLQDQLFSSKECSPLPACRYTNVRQQDFPQAFSHFTYEKSKKRLLVVDLQGVLKEHRDGTKEYILTDPAIHKRKRSKNAISRLGYLGRTDRGEKGMRAFFDSHVCTDACSLLGLVQKRS